MSISNAMASGVAGLLANASAVGSISYNIANADTVGFRRSFDQMVTTGSSSVTGTMATGVRTVETHMNTADGTYRATSISTNLAVTGGGFFVVNQNIEDGFATGNVFTRVGSFAPDEDGNLVNASGLYLMGFAYDADGALGAVDRNSYADLEPVNVLSQNMNGTQTSTVGISGNLPSQETGQATPGAPFVSSLEYYNALGEAERITLSFQPSATDDTWDVTVSDETTNYGTVSMRFANSGNTAGAPEAYTNAVSTAAAPAAFGVDLATGEMTLTVNNGDIPQTISLSLGAPGSFAGLTQFSGDYTPLNIEADGSESGILTRTEFDEFGDVWGVYDNGLRRPLYNVPLATFANPNGLATSNNSTFNTSNASGDFYLGKPGNGDTGTLTAGGVESANVDIAEELTSLIQRQRAYSSNSKIITTADEMLNETVNLKR